MQLNLVGDWFVFGVGENIEEHSELAVANSDGSGEAFVNEGFKVLPQSLSRELLINHTIFIVSHWHNPVN